MLRDQPIAERYCSVGMTRYCILLHIHICYYSLVVPTTCELTRYVELKRDIHTYIEVNSVVHRGGGASPAVTSPRATSAACCRYGGLGPVSCPTSAARWTCAGLWKWAVAALTAGYSALWVY